MAVKIADTLKALSNTFPVAESIDIDVNINGTTKRLQKAIDDGEIGGNDKIRKEIEELKSIQSLEYDGKYITCKNTLISRTSDMLIKGQTYKNVSHVKFNSANDFMRFNQTINTFEDGFIVSNSDTSTTSYGDTFTKPFNTIKPNTVYTIVIDIIENTLTDSYVLNSGGTYEDSIPQFPIRLDIPVGFVGRTIFKQTSASDINAKTGFRSFYNRGCSGKIKYRYYILEGDWTNKELPERITGIESAGEKENKISILSNNKNLTKINIQPGMLQSANGELSPSLTNYTTNINYDVVNGNQQYTISADKPVDLIFYYDENKSYISNLPTQSLKKTFITPSNCKYIRYRFLSENTPSWVQLELGNNNTPYVEHKQYKKEILLPIEGGLKSLPNGVADTIEQRNDGVYLVQKVGKYDIKEDDEIKIDSPPNQNNTIAFSINVNANNIKTSGNNICNNFNRFTSGDLYWNSDKVGILNSSNSQFKFRILKSKLSTQDVAGIKAWLKANKTTVCYEINTPVETKLDINDLDLEVYKDTTYITTENAIQPTLSFKVPSNIGGIIQSNVQNINELYNIIDENVEISNVEQMKLNDTIFPLANNKTVQLEVIKNFEGTVTYETSDPAVATVSDVGLITKKANGKATITAKCKNKSVSCEVVDLITKNSNVLQLLNIPYLHSRGITGKGVKVAIIETLVDNNEEFKIDGWYDPIGEKLYRTKPSPSDIDSEFTTINHTYHMSTLIHGKTRGVACDCELYNILAVNDSMDTPNFNDEKFNKCICDGIEWAIEFGIKVICICLYLETGNAQFREVFKKAYDAGVTICVALGNCNQSVEDVYSYYNGHLSNGYCLMIGACESNGNRNTTTCNGEAMMFNNYGYAGLQCWNPGSKYNATTNRTSAATALTTGCVALLLQQDPTLTPRQIYHIFKDNAILHSSSTPGVKSIDYGWGRINVPVLSNITYKSDAECKALNYQLPIEDINAVLVKGRYSGNNGFYKNINVNVTHDISCFVIPVEQDRYTYEFIPLNDNARLIQTDLNHNGVTGVKPGIFRMLIRLKELGISKEVSFNVK